MRHAILTGIELPDYGEPVSEPVLGRTLFEARLARLREVLEFLLDLAVPEQAAAQFVSRP